MVENKKTPKIRFAGFTDEWELRKLDDMCSIITKQTGFDYSATIKPSLLTTKENGTYPFIQNKDFDGENINLNTDFYIPIKVAEKFPKITLDVPSLLISISGKIGNVGLYNLPEKAFIGGAVGICKLTRSDEGALIVYALQSDNGQAYFHSLTKASSHANITVEDIRKIEVRLPIDIIEQKKIVHFFHELDNLITLHQRKYDKLVVMKKSMLEKMFPKYGKNVPEIRFAGFTDAWEQHKLGEVSEKIGSGKTPLGGEKTYKEYGICFIRSQNVNYGTVNFEDIVFIDDETDEEMKNSRVRNGDVLLNITGASIGRSAVYQGIVQANVNQHVCIIRPQSDEILPEFLHQNLSSDNGQSQIYSSQAGGAREGLNFQQISKLAFLFPKKKEQEQIGAFFSKIDNLITIHHRKLEKLKKVKKSMLEKMFV